MAPQVTGKDVAVSVVIPCYNQGRYLAAAIDCVLFQTFNSVEIIVVDDGSTDETAAVARSYGHRIRFISQPNRGVSATRNAGMAAARGRYVQFLDSDDLIERDKLRVHVAFLEAHPEVGIVYGDARYFTTENPALRDVGPVGEVPGRPWIPERWNRPGSVVEKLINSNLMAMDCPLVRRTVLERVGNFIEGLHANEDWEYWIRCAAAGVKFQFFADVPQTLALVRMHASSASTDLRKMRAGEFDMRVLVAPLLEQGHVRLLNCRSAFAASQAIGRAGRGRRLLRLAWAMRSAQGLLLVLVEWGFGEDALGYPLRRWMARTVPWPLQKAVSRFLQ